METFCGGEGGQWRQGLLAEEFLLRVLAIVLVMGVGQQRLWGSSQWIVLGRGSRRDRLTT